MKELEEAKLRVLKMLDNDGPYNSDGDWVRWVHEGSQIATTNAMKELNAFTSALSKKHCSMCLNLNGCKFIISKMPELPLHPGCHCQAIKISPPTAGNTAVAECNIEKFTEYIFHPTNNNGKKSLFESWGYDIMDSEWLRLEFIRQAQEKYANGEYEIGLLDGYGQRISIIIALTRGSGQEVIFKSGWMVYPNGVIKLTTPYGGKI